jgi:NAD(P)-dependent dehydrogenase (short-subunit alcohol dehydrogenase family)
MSTIDPSRLLRPGVLDGVCVLLAAGANAGGREDGIGDAVHSAFAALGARVSRWAGPLGDSSHEDQDADGAVEAALAEMPGIDLLVVDAAAPFADAGEAATGRAGSPLGACLEASWTVTRSVFNLAFMPAGRGGRILYLAPRAGGGGHSEAVLAALENLCRTLSIEWARHGVTAVTIAPGAATPAGEVAALAAYLASPAGAYFSGCLLDLRGS